MARPGVTKETIFQAAQELDDEGRPVTVTTVRDKLGKGSYTTIADALKEWHADQEKKQTADAPEIPEVLTRLMDRMWSEAWKIAHKVTESEREALVRARTQLDQERQEMSVEIGRLEKELSAAQKELASERTKREAASADLSQCQVGSARLEGRTQELEKGLREKEKRVEHLERELVTLARAGGREKKGAEKK
jgi:chromosome segregation ATPase